VLSSYAENLESFVRERYLKKISVVGIANQNTAFVIERWYRFNHTDIGLGQNLLLAQNFTDYRGKRS